MFGFLLGKRVWVFSCRFGHHSNFRAQIVIDVANFAKTENGHETGPQGTDSSLDPTFGNDFSRRIRFRPPRGPKRPEQKHFFHKKSELITTCVEITHGRCAQRLTFLQRISGCGKDVENMRARNVGEKLVSAVSGHDGGPQRPDLDDNFGAPYSF